ncbi:MAG: hypothetical protein ACR2IY_08615, partial [Rubrivivax sp.]
MSFLPSSAVLSAERATRPSVRHALMAAAACVLALGLASCGGGTSQVETFAPLRLITLGDEMSAFTADGRKYAVNALAADGTTPDCKTLPL